MVGGLVSGTHKRLSPFTDYHIHLLFSDLTAFNRNMFNNNRANWLVDYNTKYAVIPAPPPSFPPLRRHSRPSAVIPAPSAVIPAPPRHSRPSAVIPAAIPAPPLSFLPPAVIPAVFKRESILDYADVNPASANWIPA